MSRRVLPVCILILSFIFGVWTYLVTHPAPAASHIPQRFEARPSRPSSVSLPLRLRRQITVLVIGVDFPMPDPRFGRPVSRADTLIVVRFDPRSSRIDAMWIPRDTRIELPGIGITKINDAYALGGSELSIRAVERLLDIPIHHYVELDQQAFVRLIDAIGGIDIDVEKDLPVADPWTGRRLVVLRGRQRLNGYMAMHYVRFRRDALGDIGRVERQRRLLEAIARRLRSPAGLASVPRLLQIVKASVRTDVSFSQVVALGTFARRLGAERFSTVRLPGSFSPGFWEPDPPRIQQLLRDRF